MSRLVCPNCKQWEHGEITDARSKRGPDDLTYVRRYRRCRGCNRTYATMEVVRDEFLSVAYSLLEAEVAKTADSRRKESARYAESLRHELSKSTAGGSETAYPEPVTEG